MTPEEAMELLEMGVNTKQGNPSRLCETGEPYLTFTSDGIKAEGERSNGYDTIDLAVRYWLKHAILYKVNVTPKWFVGKYTLYWRTPLEVNGHDGKYYTFSRFIITDKPELENV